MRSTLLKLFLIFVWFVPVAASADEKLEIVKAFSKAADNNDIKAIDKMLADDYVSEAPAASVGKDLPAQSREQMMAAMRRAFKTMQDMGMSSRTEILKSEARDGGLVVTAVNHNQAGDRKASTESTILYKFDDDKISSTKMLEVKPLGGAGP